MKRQIRNELAFGVGIMVALMLLFMALPAEASKPNIYIDNSVTNNYNTPGETTSITQGLSDSEIAELLTVGVAAGSHQFDYSTLDWQGSIVGSWYDDESAVSFGVGKRFSKLDALFHSSYTQNGSEDLFVFGGTFRF